MTMVSPMSLSARLMQSPVPSPNGGTQQTFRAITLITASALNTWITAIPTSMAIPDMLPPTTAVRIWVWLKARKFTSSSAVFRLMVIHCRTSLSMIWLIPLKWLTDSTSPTALTLMFTELWPPTLPVHSAPSMSPLPWPQSLPKAGTIYASSTPAAAIMSWSPWSATELNSIVATSGRPTVIMWTKRVPLWKTVCICWTKARLPEASPIPSTIPQRTKVHF